MKTVIIPIDFSLSATNALHYGVDMAKAINASVMLLHVYSIPVSYAEVPVVLVSLDEMKKNAELQMEALKKETEHLVSGSVKVYSETVLGNVADEIENCCNKIKPFAVVMGSKGASNLEKIIFGSNTLTVIKHVSWPVICVPPGRIFGNGIKKIGFACDFRNVVQSTPATFIKNFTREFGAELHVLNVDFKDRHFKPDVREESLWLHTMLEDIKPQYDFIENKDVEQGIHDFVGKNNLDLVIAIPKKHKLLDALFKSSSTRQLVFHSHVPVMCVHE